MSNIPTVENIEALSELERKFMHVILTDNIYDGLTPDNMADTAQRVIGMKHRETAVIIESLSDKGWITIDKQDLSTDEIAPDDAVLFNHTVNYWNVRDNIVNGNVPDAVEQMKELPYFERMYCIDTLPESMLKRVMRTMLK